METDKRQKIFIGIPASAGIVVGRAFVISDDGDFCPVRREIDKGDTKKEIQRYRDALTETKKEMSELKIGITKTLGKDYARLAEAYQQILADPLIVRDVPARISEGINAEYALYIVLDKVIKSFDMIPDPYFKDRKNDIEDLANKIMSHLMGRAKRPLSEIGDDSIVIAKNISPNDTVTMQEKRALGFVTEGGGKTSHISILAQTLEIPAVVGVIGILAFVNDGDIVVIDGVSGRVIINPDEELIANYRAARARFVTAEREFEKIRDLPAQTLDGKRIELSANFDNLQELPFILNAGAEGIGLFRTEYLYIGRSDLPVEEELFDNYSKIAEKMLPYGVIVRTLDIGGDKVPDPMLRTGKECPTFLGLRAIRLCLKFPHIFRPQLRAILRASAFGKIKILFPMISDIREFLEAKKIVEEIKDELDKEGLPYDRNIETGAMVEVPSAAMTCDFIAREADFVSVGTNDLIQYMMAVDRTDENVAFLYDPSHPAILRMLKNIVEASHKAGIWVGMCGEMASDHNYTGLLVGMGFDEFSVPASAIGKIKKTIRSVNYADMSRKVTEILALDDPEKIKKELKRLV
ncbi:MAG: phosphoenolpyruvate--protein phosphotransferase [Elusimicrobia bacterium HGW-Elusimicrobia-1]|jgi:phosphotransferase system enzyme I (PtsI)|nr:MAG: phosphoenolpyruvate--protein phosphotransferase [Elusimicrobia bacterium HGW-Elusimicrobia-1]